MSDKLLELNKIYRRRFERDVEYRDQVWRILTGSFFPRFVGAEDTVLDLGCGYGEFINNIVCARKYAMDANPDANKHVRAGVEVLLQDCSQTWNLPDECLDVVFTSNFFEHLPTKAALRATVDQARRCLKKGGLLVALGPNVKFLPGRYWDFWDHYLPLTESSIGELAEISGFKVVESIGRFLPYTMSDGRRYPSFLIRLYLGLPFLWRFFGRQFLVVARRI